MGVITELKNLTKRLKSGKKGPNSERLDPERRREYKAVLMYLHSNPCVPMREIIDDITRAGRGDAHSSVEDLVKAGYVEWVRMRYEGRFARCYAISDDVTKRDLREFMSS